MSWVTSWWRKGKKLYSDLEIKERINGELKKAVSGVDAETFKKRLVKAVFQGEKQIVVNVGGEHWKLTPDVFMEMLDDCLTVVKYNKLQEKFIEDIDHVF